MPRPALWMLAAGAVLVAAGLALLARNVQDYLASPTAIDSSAGLVVFTVDGQLVSYLPFALGVEPLLIGIGLVLIVASVFVAAGVWQRRV